MTRVFFGVIVLLFSIAAQAQRDPPSPRDPSSPRDPAFIMQELQKLAWLASAHERKRHET